MPNMFGGDQFEDGYGHPAARVLKCTDPRGHSHREQHEVYMQERVKAYDPKTAASIAETGRRNLFQLEWVTFPKALQQHFRELKRYPTDSNYTSIIGFISGYACAKPGAFSDAYAQAVAHALYAKEKWIHDEVQHARVSD